MILNLTQHPSTPEQGAFEPKDKEKVRQLLTFESLPSGEEIIDRADELAKLAREEFDWRGIGDESDREVMIGGAMWLMAPLETALRSQDMFPVYSFSKRTCVETLQPDGGITKVSAFKHAGFVLAAGVGMGDPWEPA